MIKMSVKTSNGDDDCCRFLDDHLMDEDVCFYEILSNDDPLLSDDIWKKFELEKLPFPGLESILSDLEEQNSNTSSSFNLGENLCEPEIHQRQPREIRNHDCMWAGHCGSKEHPADAASFCRLTAAPIAPGGCSASSLQVKTPVSVAAGKQPVVGAGNPPSTTMASVQAGRSLLLKTVLKQQVTPTPLGPSPESPPISDDEGHMSPNAILKALYDAIEECDEVDEDSDLCEYFEEAEEEEEEEEDEDEDFEFAAINDELRESPTPPPVVATSHKPHFTPEIDHSYHKGKLPHAHIAALGIETPSDSEEEIDVVSVSEKQTTLNNGRCGYVLPNNPTFKDRQHLQKTMASAIQIKQEMSDNRRMNSNVVTSSGTTTPGNAPFPKPELSCVEKTPVKRRLPEPRSIKRNKIKHYRITPTTSPYKRRMGYSSDSEPEPSEKRSLHNNMERQRRIDLRNAFDCLRMLVPEVAGRDRAPKVVILREAASYCDHLGDVSTKLHRQLDELRKQQERLRARVSQLRRNLAAKR